uniref:Structural maintenance of chromosome-related protein n=1 Tax=uncultured marine thaumarchaeote AD1000_38_A02 TaxID=1455911 RepID=A0A075FPG4_9ARCH|nr:Structural maintenance of chromosome-related protein [uncultured marine thaumarchaeote AD1000_38_A02]
MNSLDDEKTTLSNTIDELSETIRNNESTVAKERANLEHTLKNKESQLTQEITTLEQELQDKTVFLNTSGEALSDLKTNVESLTSQEKLLSDESRKMKPILDALDKEIKSHLKNKESIQRHMMENTTKSQNTENNTSRLSDSINTYQNNLNELGTTKLIEYFSGAETLLIELDKEYNYLRTRVNLLADEQYREIYFGYKGFSERKTNSKKKDLLL